MRFTAVGKAYIQIHVLEKIILTEMREQGAVLVGYCNCSGNEARTAAPEKKKKRWISRSMNVPSHLRSEDKMSSRLTPTLCQLGGDSHQHKYKWKSRFGKGKGGGAILHVFGETATWKCQAGSRISGFESKKGDLY